MRMAQYPENCVAVFRDVLPQKRAELAGRHVKWCLSATVHKQIKSIAQLTLARR
jgi:hypothetical protein